MNKFLIGTITGLFMLTGLTAQNAYSDVLGLDFSVEGEYNMDNSTSTLTSEIGKTIMLSGLSLSSDADFDVLEMEYKGMDFKANYNVDVLSGVDVYIKSGMTKDWAREDIVAGFSLSF